MDRGGVCNRPVNAQRPTRADVVTAAVPRRVVLGLFSRKERWGFSWKGRLLLLLLLIGLAICFVYGVYPFLAITHRVNATNLVIEGWIHRYAFRVGTEEFNSGAYVRVFTTGGPVVGIGHYINDYQTSASLGSAALKQLGIAADLVQMVPSHEIGRDRTYSSAVALREWFRDHKMPVQSMNVLTEATHARRTRFLFQKAFGNNVKVGIISVPNPDYDPKHWWRSSEGVKDVIFESVAYMYARLFFYPSETRSEALEREVLNR